jgi:ribosome-associated toxin RatA of RatAB toxin-antitoxin module
LEGPFRHLKGLWRFDDLIHNQTQQEIACRISFDLEFELSNRIIDMALGPVLEKIANSFMEAFSERAKSIYGKK